MYTLLIWVKYFTKEHELFQNLKLFVKTNYGKVIFNYLDTNL